MVDSLDNPQLPDLEDIVQMKSIKKEKPTKQWLDYSKNTAPDNSRGDLECEGEAI